MLSFEGKRIDFGANKPKLWRFEIRAFCDKMRPFCDDIVKWAVEQIRLQDPNVSLC